MAEILRLLSSTSEIWKEETSLFYYNLSSRGYPRRFLRTVFQEVTWARRSEVLATNRKKQCEDFFQKYRACVFTLRNAPEWPKLRELLDLNLTELSRTTFGDIFQWKNFDLLHTGFYSSMCFAVNPITHLPLGSMQRTTARIIAKTLINAGEAGALGPPDLHR